MGQYIITTESGKKYKVTTEQGAAEHPTIEAKPVRSRHPYVPFLPSGMTPREIGRGASLIARGAYFGVPEMMREAALPVALSTLPPFLPPSTYKKVGSLVEEMFTKQMEKIPAPQTPAGRLAEGAGATLPLLVLSAPYQAATRTLPLISKAWPIVQSMVAGTGYGGTMAALNKVPAKEIPLEALKTGGMFGGYRLAGKAGATALPFAPRLGSAAGAGAVGYATAPEGEKEASAVMGAGLGFLYPSRAIRSPKTIPEFREIATKTMDKVLRPTATGKVTYSQKQKYNEQVNTVIEEIIKNKNKITQESPLPSGQNVPQDINDLHQAHQRTEKIFYDNWKNLEASAGKQSYLPVENVISKLNTEFVNNPNKSKEVRNSAKKIISHLDNARRNLGAVTEIIEDFNQDLKSSFAKNDFSSLVQPKAKAQIMLRDLVDKFISSKTGGAWQAERNKYAAFKVVEKDLARAVYRNAKASGNGGILGQLSNVYGNMELASSIFSSNPQYAITRGLISKGSSWLLRRMTDENLKIKNVFKEADRLYGKETNMPLKIPVQNIPSQKKTLTAPKAGGLSMSNRVIPPQINKWLSKGITIREVQAPIRIIEPEARIKDISGKMVSLPKSHEMIPYKLTNGKIWLHDGKDVIVERGQLQNLKNKNLVLGEKSFISPEEAQVEEVVTKNETKNYTINDIEYQGIKDNNGVKFHIVKVPDNILQLPVTQYPTRTAALERALQKTQGYDKTKFSQYQLQGGENYREITHKLSAYPVEPETTHFNEMASWHRVNDRTTPQGKKVYFIEEIQKNKNLDKVTGHPLGKSKYIEFELKSAIKEAVEKGYDYISWTTGEQQAERYDLSKQVDVLKYNPHSRVLIGTKRGQDIITEHNVSPEDLPKYVGKDIPERLKNVEPDGLGYHILSGENLKIGGEWAKSLYDKQIPNILKDLTKGNIENISIDIADKTEGRLNWQVIDNKGDVYDAFKTQQDALDSIKDIGYPYNEGFKIQREKLNKEMHIQPALKITSEIKARVFGQPMAGGLVPPLYEKARKYKSAEEFVKAQGTPVYHGTNIKNADMIERNPRLLSADEQNQFPTTVVGDTQIGISSSRDKGMADYFASLQPFEKNKTIEIYLPKKDFHIYTLPEGIDSIDSLGLKKLQEIKAKGFDAIEDIKNIGGENEIRILSPEKIKTKSQLTDIWNEANKGKK